MMPQFGNRPESEPGYSALIGDVVESRRIEKRADFQNRLQDLIGLLNEEHQDDLASPLELASGDEMQGLFHQPQAVVSVAVRLAEDLYPVRFAYGLGYGALTTEIQDHTHQTDGHCFHLARSALEQTRKGRRRSPRNLEKVPRRSAKACKSRRGWPSSCSSDG